MREIAVKYEGGCARCGKGLAVGNPAMYEKSMGIFCLGCEPVEVDDIRAFRAARAERKADRMRGKADRLYKEAERRQSAFNRGRQDWAWLTQPGHIPGRDKALEQYDKGMRCRIEADEIRKQAESLVIHKTIVKGDAERRRQAKRDALDTVLKKGARVNSVFFGPGEIVGVYKKSYRVKFDRGFTQSTDKSWVSPLED